MVAAREIFDYRVRSPSLQRRQGEHPSVSTGEGGAYRGDVLLREASQVRHLSLRATLRDPFERLWAREYLQNASLDLWVLVDLSASMRVAVKPIAAPDGPGAAGCITAARLIAAAANSSHGLGDRLGVIAAAGDWIRACSMPASRHLPGQLALARRVAELAILPGAASPAVAASGTDSAQGLAGAAARIGPRRALVFVVSDFQELRSDWRLLFERLVHHDVVPVVTWNLPAASLMRARGLVSVVDAETGMRRTVWMRDGLRRRIRTSLDDRHGRLESLFASFRRRGVHLYDGFDAPTLTAYFRGATRQETIPGDRLA